LRKFKAECEEHTEHEIKKFETRGIEKNLLTLPTKIYDFNIPYHHGYILVKYEKDDLIADYCNISNNERIAFVSYCMYWVYMLLDRRQLVTETFPSETEKKKYMRSFKLRIIKEIFRKIPPLSRGNKIPNF
jgi:hypothetical protein